MKQRCEYVWGLRYKLRMMGINISSCLVIYGDNQFTLYQTGISESSFKKKKYATTNHFIREGVAMNQ